MTTTFLCGRFEFELDQPLVMGIVNVTPDSFFDGGIHQEVDKAIAHAHQLIAEGAHIIDIGGESTRPGSRPVSQTEELARVLPVVEALRESGVSLSVDTSKPMVMRAVLDAGADMINDVQAFRQPGAIEAVGTSRCGLCVMHMKGEPFASHAQTEYSDLLGDIGLFLGSRAQKLRAAWVDPRRIVLDPGFGFDKTAEQNYQLLRRLSSLRASSYPLLVGVSRKSMIGHATGRDVADRLAGSLAAVLACVARGAAIVRVHDVAATVDALKVWQAAEHGAIPVDKCRIQESRARGMGQKESVTQAPINVLKVQTPVGAHESPKVQTPVSAHESPKVQTPVGAHESPKVQTPVGAHESAKVQMPVGAHESPKVQTVASSHENPRAETLDSTHNSSPKVQSPDNIHKSAPIQTPDNTHKNLTGRTSNNANKNAKIQSSENTHKNVKRQSSYNTRKSAKMQSPDTPAPSKSPKAQPSDSINNYLKTQTPHSATHESPQAQASDHPNKYFKDTDANKT